MPLARVIVGRSTRNSPSTTGVRSKTLAKEFAPICILICSNAPASAVAKHWNVLSADEQLAHFQLGLGRHARFNLLRHSHSFGVDELEKIRQSTSIAEFDVSYFGYGIIVGIGTWKEGRA